MAGNTSLHGALTLGAFEQTGAYREPVKLPGAHGRAVHPECGSRRELRHEPGAVVEVVEVVAHGSVRWIR